MIHKVCERERERFLYIYIYSRQCLSWVMFKNIACFIKILTNASKALWDVTFYHPIAVYIKHVYCWSSNRALHVPYIKLFTFKILPNSFQVLCLHVAFYIIFNTTIFSSSFGTSLNDMLSKEILLWRERLIWFKVLVN